MHLAVAIAIVTRMIIVATCDWRRHDLTQPASIGESHASMPGTTKVEYLPSNDGNARVEVSAFEWELDSNRLGPFGGQGRGPFAEGEDTVRQR